MNLKTLLLAAAIFTPTAVHANEKSTASWWYAEPQTHKLQTVIELKLKEGWHTYWENPGEGGMTPEIEIELPKGWAAGPIQFPVPKRFTTGELPGFGYENKVLLCLNLIPPFGFDGRIPPITAKLDYLICNDNACVPGKANLNLKLHDESNFVPAAYAKIPKKLDQAKMVVTPKDDLLEIRLTLPNDAQINPAEFEIFPLTRNVIDPDENPRFKASDDDPTTWTTTAKQNEYYDPEGLPLTIVISNPNGESYQIDSTH